jgi:hypothetical protein
MIDKEGDQMFGAENVADLVLSRGAGEFDLDYNNEEVRSRLDTTFICEKHLNELYHNWKRDGRHFIHRGKEQKVMCSVPNEYAALHTSNDGKQVPDSGQYLQKKEAMAFLLQSGVLLHVGIRKLSKVEMIYIVYLFQQFAELTLYTSMMFLLRRAAGGLNCHAHIMLHMQDREPKE